MQRFGKTRLHFKWLLSRMGSNLFDTGGSIPSYSPSFPLWSGSENLYFIRFCPPLIGRISLSWLIESFSWLVRISSFYHFFYGVHGVYGAVSTHHKPWHCAPSILLFPNCILFSFHFTFKDAVTLSACFFLMLYFKRMSIIR